MKRIVFFAMLKYHNVAFALCVLIVICSCSNNSLYSVDKEILYSTLPAPKDITGYGKKLNQVIGSYHIANAGAYVVVLSSDPSGYINILDKETGNIVLKCGCRGRGPGEFTSIPESRKYTVSNEEGDILLYINDSRNIGALNINKSVSSGRGVYDSFCPMLDYMGEYGKRNYSFKSIFPKDGSVFMCLGVSYLDPRDGFTGPPGYVLKTDSRTLNFNIFPSLIDNGSYMNLPYSIYCGFERMSGGRDKVVLFSIALDAHVVIDLDKHQTTLVRDCTKLFLEDYVTMSEDEILAKTVNNTMDIDAGYEHMAQLFDGRSIGDVNQGTGRCVPCVRIWDYDGNLKAHYSMEIPAKSIAFDEENNEIYVIDNDDYIYSFDLDVI